MDKKTQRSVNYYKVHLRNAGFEEDLKDYGSTTFSFHKFYKPGYEVWILKDYTNQHLDICCVKCERGKVPEINIACTYKNSTFMVEKADLNSLFKIICKHEPETWIKVFAEYNTNCILGALDG